jgi:hypothetical protein
MRNRVRFCFYLLLAACAAAEQAQLPKASSFTIRGSITDSYTNQPVEDAEVSIVYLGETAPSGVAGIFKAESPRSIHSDFAGRFTAELDRAGVYSVSLSKAGYFATGNRSQRVAVSSERPTADIHFSLTKPAQLSGLIVDEASKEPVSGVHVLAWNASMFASFSRGAQLLGRPSFGTDSVSDSEGKFRIAELLPGTYVIELGPATRQEERVASAFSEADLKTIDRDIELKYWPGGPDPSTAIPLDLQPGASRDLGILTVKTVEYYRVLIRVPPGGCPAGDKVFVYEQLPGRLLEVSRAAPCGRDLLISRFLPGDHKLALVRDGGPDKRATAVVSFTIFGKNVEVPAPLVDSFELRGGFEVAEGAKDPVFAHLRVSLHQEGMLPFVDLAGGKNADSKGQFRFPAVPPLSTEIRISGLDAGYYVKEVRYNGIAIDYRRLALQNPALNHDVVIVLDDKAAVLSGTIRAGDKEVAGCAVIVAKWPQPVGEQVYFNGFTDVAGRFRIEQLAPGEYRLVALRSPDEVRNMAAAMMERLLASGPKIELGPQNVREVSADLTVLR